MIIRSNYLSDQAETQPTHNIIKHTNPEIKPKAHRGKVVFSPLRQCSSLKFVCNDLNLLSSMKEMLYEVRCLKSNEAMILALAGQFKECSMKEIKHFFHTTFLSRENMSPTN